jgi:CDP-diglyceride synthetase
MVKDLFDEEMFAEDPPPRERPPREPRRRRNVLGGETARRVLVAIPWIAFAIAIVVFGGPVFALAMAGIGVLCLREYFLMTAPLRPLQPAAYVAVVATIAAAYFGTAFNVLLLATASFLLLFFFGARLHPREGVVVAMGVTVLGALWIGLPLVHAVLLRELPDHGAALLIDVLVGTFATDTGAYATSRPTRRSRGSSAAS